MMNGAANSWLTSGGEGVASWIGGGPFGVRSLFSYLYRQFPFLLSVEFPALSPSRLIDGRGVSSVVVWIFGGSTKVVRSDAIVDKVFKVRSRHRCFDEGIDA